MNKTFNLELVELPKIKRINIDGKRHYVREDGTSCTPYPSVTTIISSCKNTTRALNEWRKRVGHETANKISSQAASKGTSVHQLIEDYCLNKESSGKVMPNSLDMFSRLRMVADEYIDNIKVVEGLMYSDHLRTAGTVDMIAEFDGKLSIIDWKTSSRRKTRSKAYNYFKQEAAYAVMFEEMTSIPVTQLVTVITDQEGGCSVFIEHRDEWIDDFIKLRDSYELELQGVS
jgi:genome maintenance exonuclease 1